VVAPDLYGYGNSPAWPGDRAFRLEDELKLIAPILENRDRFHLVGHSYGGLVALKLALSYPARVASLTLYEPICFFLLAANDPAFREIQTVRDETTRLIEAGEPEAAAQYFVEYWVMPGAWSHTSAAARQAIAGSMAKVRIEWPNAFHQPTLAAKISDLAMPVLLLTGAATTAAAQGASRHLRGLLPGAEMVEFSGLGHMGPVTNPAPVNEAIATFLRRVEEPEPVLVA
jgi:pimeloyl-ACP methyl ester carboxylesterase